MNLMSTNHEYLSSSFLESTSPSHKSSSPCVELASPPLNRAPLAGAGRRARAGYVFILCSQFFFCWCTGIVRHCTIYEIIFQKNIWEKNYNPKYQYTWPFFDLITLALQIWTMDLFEFSAMTTANPAACLPINWNPLANPQSNPARRPNACHSSHYDMHR